MRGCCIRLSKRDTTATMLILLGKVAQLRAGGTSLIALTNLSLPPLEEAWSGRVQLLDKSAKSGTNKLFD